MRTALSLVHALTVLVAVFALVACGDDDSSNEAAPVNTADATTSPGDTTSTGDTTTTPTGDGYRMDCEALASLFKTTATQSVADWTGYWLCYQESNGCSGEACSFAPESLPEYVLSGDCASAGSCTIDGETVDRPADLGDGRAEYDE